MDNNVRWIVDGDYITPEGKPGEAVLYALDGGDEVLRLAAAAPEMLDQLEMLRDMFLALDRERRIQHDRDSVLIYRFIKNATTLIDSLKPSVEDLPNVILPETDWDRS